MKTVTTFLLRLYPANWRDRYGDEFEALLEDSPPGPFGMFDLLKGAIKMQLTVPAFPKLAVVLSLAGLLAGLGVSFLVSPRYVSTALMTFDGSRKNSSPNLNQQYLKLKTPILSRTSLSNIIQDPRLDLYKSERASEPLEDVIEKMRSEDIQIAADANVGVAGDSLAFRVSFAYRDGVKAQQTVQTLITKFQDANVMSQQVSANGMRGHSYDEVDRLEQRLTAIEKRLGLSAPPPTPADLPVVPPDAINLDVVDPPSLPVRPVSPNRAVFMLSGFGTGFASALIIAIFRRKLPPIPFPAQTA